MAGILERFVARVEPQESLHTAHAQQLYSLLRVDVTHLCPPLNARWRIDVLEVGGQAIPALAPARHEWELLRCDWTCAACNARFRYTDAMQAPRCALCGLCVGCALTRLARLRQTAAITPPTTAAAAVAAVTGAAGGAGGSGGGTGGGTCGGTGGGTYGGAGGGTGGARGPSALRRVREETTTEGSAAARGGLPPPNECAALSYSLGMVASERNCEWALPPVDVDFTLLLSLLEPANIVTVFAALLTEQQVLVLCRHIGVLTNVTAALVALMYPLEWPHIYIPVLPRGLDTFLDAPIPYLIGASPDCLDDYVLHHLPKHVVVVDLDTNTVTEDLPDSTLLPLRQSMKLVSALLRCVVV